MKNKGGRVMAVVGIVMALSTWAWPQGRNAITTVAGGYVGDGGPAMQAVLNLPGDVIADAAGNLYIADTSNNRIRRIDGLTGTVTTVAGNGEASDGGDGGPATKAGLFLPSAIALDAAGNLYIADSGNNRVRKVTLATGLITTVAGTGESGFSGDRDAATKAKITFPSGVAVDAAGNLYISDTGNRRIRRVQARTGTITTVAGGKVVGGGTKDEPFIDLGPSGDGGPATEATLGMPLGITLDATGNLHIADSFHHRVRRVEPGGAITTVAGSNAPVNAPGDGLQATAAWLQSPEDVTVDAQGNLYITDGGDHRLRRVDRASGVITTVVGTGMAGFSGDGQAAAQAKVNRPSSAAFDRGGNLYVGDRRNHRVRRVDAASGTIMTIAGAGTFAGDDRPATQASLNFPRAVAVDSTGNVFIADSSHHRIRRIDGATGVITTLAGDGRFGYGGDGGPATSAQLTSPEGVAVDASGHVYIADTGNHCIRRVDSATGVITTVAGTGVRGSSGDGGPASASQLFAPSSVALDAQGNVYVADTGNHRIRRVDSATGVITTVAGTGSAGFQGDRSAATSARLNLPNAVAVDPSGNLLIADSANHRVRRVDRPTGVITTVAGSGDAGNFGGDNGAATQASLDGPEGVAVDAAGNVYIADTFNHRIRRVDARRGTIATVAGNGEPGFSGDGAAATQARLDGPAGIAVDAQGNLYIADTSNHRVRRVSAR